MSAWTIADIPAQNDRLAIVTGVGGLGFQTALALAGAGASVVLAGRNDDKGQASLARIRGVHPRAEIRFERLDLADLSSVAAFARRVTARYDRIDLLVNNAGIMAPPERRLTADGFELQFGTNYLGHFALTALLLPALSRARGRVVNVSSSAELFGRIAFDDLQAERHYGANRGYAQSKLALSMFALELQRRSDAHGWGLTAVAAQPGLTRTDLIPNGMGKPNLVLAFLTPIASHSAAEGAKSILYAATMPGVRGGDYYGPDGPLALIGSPHNIRYPKNALDVADAERLWDVSQKITHVRFALDDGALSPAV